jgi:hypothetical protein
MPILEGLSRDGQIAMGNFRLILYIWHDDDDRMVRAEVVNLEGHQQLGYRIRRYMIHEECKTIRNPKLRASSSKSSIHASITKSGAGALLHFESHFKWSQDSQRLRW